MTRENTVSATGREDTAPRWQKHLKGAHVPRKGFQFKGSEGEKRKRRSLQPTQTGEGYGK